MVRYRCPQVLSLKDCMRIAMEKNVNLADIMEWVVTRVNGIELSLP
jgi:hypothetical protein